jgi:hypothetical protein
VEIMASKVLTDGKVELKTRVILEADTMVRIWSFVQVNDEWKSHGEVQAYTTQWEQNGQIQVLSQ